MPYVLNCAIKTLVNHWNLSDYRTSRIRYGLRADGIINRIIRNRLLFKMKSPGPEHLAGAMMNVACPNRASVCARHTKTQEQRDDLPIIRWRSYLRRKIRPTLYGLTEITENYACGRLSRSVLLKKKKRETSP